MKHIVRINPHLCPAVVGLAIDLELKSEIASNVLTTARTDKKLRDYGPSMVESRSGIDRNATPQHCREIQMGYDHAVAGGWGDLRGTYKSGSVSASCDLRDRPENKVGDPVMVQVEPDGAIARDGDVAGCVDDLRLAWP